MVMVRWLVTALLVFYWAGSAATGPALSALEFRQPAGGLTVSADHDKLFIDSDGGRLSAVPVRANKPARIGSGFPHHDGVPVAQDNAGPGWQGRCLSAASGASVAAPPFLAVYCPRGPPAA